MPALPLKQPHVFSHVSVLLLLAVVSSSAKQLCVAPITNSSTCAGSSFKATNETSIAGCCGLCASVPTCFMWEYAPKRPLNCHLKDKPACATKKDCRCTCGSLSSPPLPPSPPAPSPAPPAPSPAPVPTPPTPPVAGFQPHIILLVRPYEYV